MNFTCREVDKLHMLGRLGILWCRCFCKSWINISLNYKPKRLKKNSKKRANSKEFPKLNKSLKKSQKKLQKNKILNDNINYIVLSIENIKLIWVKKYLNHVAISNQ